jgi:hypothetical protein
MAVVFSLPYVNNIIIAVTTITVKSRENYYKFEKIELKSIENATFTISDKLLYLLK